MGVRTRRLPGRHTDTAATQAGPPTVRIATPTEDIPMTAQPTAQQPRPVTDAALEDLFECHVRAMGRAQAAYEKAVPLEDRVRSEVERGDRARDQVVKLRQQIADLDRQADEAYNAAEALGQPIQELHAEKNAHLSDAAGLNETIQRHVDAGGADPRERRQQTGPQQLPPTALDLPLAQVEQTGPPPVGSADTRGFVAVSSGAPIGAAT